MYTMKIILLDILLICAIDEIFAVRRVSYNLRPKRHTQPQDSDTCKTYNANLQKMWSQLSKFLNSSDTVNQMALHNIAVMVDAYLDHQKQNTHEKFDVGRKEKKRDKISVVLKKVKKLLGKDDSEEKVREMIMGNFKPEYNGDQECKQANEDNLLTSIALSYQNYLENAECRGDYDTGLLRGKALLRTGRPKLTNILNTHDHELDDTKRSILNEDQSSKYFHKGKMSRLHHNIRRRNNVRRLVKRSANRRHDLHVNLRSLPLRRKSKTKPKSKSSKKGTHMRSDETCVKYANRKFLITMRTSIERFMDLRDCQQDDTLRTSKQKRNEIVPTSRKEDRNHPHEETKEQSQINIKRMSKNHNSDGRKIFPEVYSKIEEQTRLDNNVLTTRTTSQENVFHNNVFLDISEEIEEQSQINNSPIMSSLSGYSLDSEKIFPDSDEEMDDQSPINRDDNFMSETNFYESDDRKLIPGSDEEMDEQTEIQTDVPTMSATTDRYFDDRKNSHDSDEEGEQNPSTSSMPIMRTTSGHNLDERDIPADKDIQLRSKTKSYDLNFSEKNNKPAGKRQGETDDRKISFAESDITQDEQIQINEYLSKLPDFKGQDPSKINKSIFVLHSGKYKNALLEKLKQTQSKSSIGQNSILFPYSSAPDIKKKNDLSSYNMQSAYDKIYKSFLDSSNIRSILSTNVGKTKQKQKRNGSNSLFEEIKKSILAKNNKSMFEGYVRQNDDDNTVFIPFEPNNQTEILNDENSTIIDLPSPPLIGTSINFDALDNILSDVRNMSLQNPQFDMSNLGTDVEKGYVELSYLVKYPKTIVYQPQYLVKNILQYNDFIKIAHQLYMTDDDKQLLKIVRYLPDNSTQLLFETKDFKSPLEIHDVRSDSKTSSTNLSTNTSCSTDGMSLRKGSNDSKGSNYTADIKPENDYLDLDTSTDATLLNDNLNVNPDEMSRKYITENDYLTYQDGKIAETLNDTSDINEFSRSKNDSNSDQSLNLTEYKYESGEIIDEAVITLLNFTGSTEDLFNQTDAFDVADENITSSISIADDEDDDYIHESIADYLRLSKSSPEDVVKSASPVNLKNLESQGVTASSLTKAMLTNWWNAWKERLSSKVQTIAGRVSKLLTKLEHPSSKVDIKVVDDAFEGV